MGKSGKRGEVGEGRVEEAEYEIGRDGEILMKVRESKRALLLASAEEKKNCSRGGSVRHLCRLLEEVGRSRSGKRRGFRGRERRSVRGIWRRSDGSKENVGARSGAHRGQGLEVRFAAPLEATLGDSSTKRTRQEEITLPKNSGYGQDQNSGENYNHSKHQATQPTEKTTETKAKTRSARGRKSSGLGMGFEVGNRVANRVKSWRFFTPKILMIPTSKNRPENVTETASQKAPKTAPKTNRETNSTAVAKTSLRALQESTKISAKRAPETLTRKCAGIQQRETIQKSRERGGS